MLNINTHAGPDLNVFDFGIFTSFFFVCKIKENCLHMQKLNKYKRRIPRQDVTLTENGEKKSKYTFVYLSIFEWNAQMRRHIKLSSIHLSRYSVSGGSQ